MGNREVLLETLSKQGKEHNQRIDTWEHSWSEESMWRGQMGIKDGRHCQAVTVVNGNISKPFDILRGCHQGDPISGYLVILVN